MNFTDKLLLKIGEYLGLDLKYFVTNQLILSVATAVSALSGFLLSVLLARFVDKTTFGQYSLVLSIVTTLGFTGIYGLRSILPFEISKGREGFYSQAVKYSLFGSLAGSLFLIGCGLYYLKPDKPELFTSFLAAAVLFPFTNSFVFYQGVLTAKNMFVKQSLFSIIKSIIPTIAVAVVVLTKPVAFWLVTVGLLFQALVDLVFTKKTLSSMKNNKKSPEGLRYGLRLSGIWLLPMATANLDKILIAKVLGFEALAVYTFATLIPQQITNFLKNFQPLAIYKIGGMEKSQIKKDLPRKSLHLLFFIFPVIVLYVLVSPFIFKFFYPTYLESIPYSQIYAFGILGFPTTILTQSFHRLRQFRNTFKFTIFTVFVKLAVIYIFVINFGLFGAALAYVVNSFFEYIVARVLVSYS